MLFKVPFFVCLTTNSSKEKAKSIEKRWGWRNKRSYIKDYIKIRSNFVDKIQYIKLFISSAPQSVQTVFFLSHFFFALNNEFHYEIRLVRCISMFIFHQCMSSQSIYKEIVYRHFMLTVATALHVFLHFNFNRRHICVFVAC